MHGQAVIAGTRVPVSVILDCLAAGMRAGEIIAEYLTVTAEACVQPLPKARRWGGRNCSRYRNRGEVQLDENLPVSSAAILAKAGHDVDTVADEALVGAPAPDVVAAATAAGRILISLDRGLADIRAYPPAAMPASLSYA